MSSDERINPDRLYSPRQVSTLESISLASVYVRLARSEYLGFKDNRKTVIPGSAILDRRRKNLKPATFKLPVPQGSRFHTIRRSA
jgi:hypothetical protein